MTDATNNDEPTAEELAAANAVIARKAAASYAKIKVLLDDASFAQVLAAATDLRSRFQDGTPFYAHLNAIVVGMTGLQRDVAVLAPPATLPAA